jgi:hypothetical protein
MFTTVDFFLEVYFVKRVEIKKFCASFILLFFFVSFVPLIPLIVDHFDCKPNIFFGAVLHGRRHLSYVIAGEPSGPDN